MDIRRQRLAQLNSKFRQTGSSTNPPNLPSQTILPDSSRPLPRQQPRTKFYEKETIYPVSTTVRPDSATLKGQTTNPDRLAEKKYITLANLTKILQMLQSRTRVNEYDTSTVMSSSTSHSAKPRVQQHLQRTAVRWWRPTTRNSETSTQTSTSTTSSRFSSPLRKSSSSVQQKPKAFEQENFPLLTIVTNSARKTRVYQGQEDNSSNEENPESVPMNSANGSTVKSVKFKQNLHEPIIMQTRANRHQPYRAQQNSSMQFFHQRLVRQT